MRKTEHHSLGLARPDVGGVLGGGGGRPFLTPILRYELGMRLRQLQKAWQLPALRDCEVVGQMAWASLGS